MFLNFARRQAAASVTTAKTLSPYHPSASRQLDAGPRGENRDDMYNFHAREYGGGDGYDDGGFFNYVNGRREESQPTVRPPPGGWLGGASSNGAYSREGGAAAPPNPASPPPGGGPSAVWVPPASFSGSGTRAAPAVQTTGGSSLATSDPHPGRSTPPSPAQQLPPVGLAGGGSSGGSGPAATTDSPAYPQSFHEVMEMVSKGITPPNVRTDIKDTPPDPNRPPSEPRSQPVRKPWEQRGGGGSVSPGNGPVAPWESSVPASPPWSQDASPPTMQQHSQQQQQQQQQASLVSDASSTPAQQRLSEVSAMSAPAMIGWGSSLPRVGPPGLLASTPPPSAYPNKVGGAGGPGAVLAASSSSSIYASPAAGDFGAPSHDPMNGGSSGGSSSGVGTTLSVLQPLMSGGSSWRPPSPPAPTISHMMGANKAVPGGPLLQSDEGPSSSDISKGNMAGARARVEVEAE